MIWMHFSMKRNVIVLEIAQFLLSYLYTPRTKCIKICVLLEQLAAVFQSKSSSTNILHSTAPLSAA